MPIGMLAMKVSPQKALKPMSSLMHWGLKAFSKPPYGTLLKVEASGEVQAKTGRMDVTVSHPDGYQLTAIPVAACVLQYLDGLIKKPGLWMQAQVVEPESFLHDMQRMGVEITIKKI
jgi:saccharopine dehydrogenase (NAD+, L-lysine-forming)